MSNWAFVAIAYTLVWGSLALYAVLLARRVSQARQVMESLQQTGQHQVAERDGTVCDTPPVP